MMEKDFKSRSTYTGGDILGKPTYRPAPDGTPTPDAVWSPTSKAGQVYLVDTGQVYLVDIGSL